MITDFNARGGEVIDLIALNLGEWVAAGDGEENADEPVFADFKVARISDNADGHTVINRSEGYRITLIGVTGDDLPVAPISLLSKRRSRARTWLLKSRRRSARPR